MTRALNTIFRLALVFIGLSFAQAASAQAVFTYVNGTNGAINSTTTCAAPLVRNFAVVDSFTVTDVDIGVFATHTWRGDMRITLQAPDGTRIQIVDGDGINTSGDHFNVRLNDGGTQTVNTDSATGNHSTTPPPPFENDFIPNAPLAGFNGKNSNGTWRLEICDIFPPGDNGTFQHAELYLTSAPPNYADLSLTKSVSNAAPANGATISYTLLLANAASSPGTATDVDVADLLPPGVTYSSHTGNGTYVPGTGIWTVASIAPGQTRSLTIQAVVTATAGATVTNTAEVISSSLPDVDSTPNNGATGEDDYAETDFTVSGPRVAGTPPVLACPNGSILFDWDTRTWVAGSTNNNYALGALGIMNIAITNPGVFVNNALFGGQSPVLQTTVTGGLVPAQQSLMQLVNLNNQSDVVTTTLTLPNILPGAQFTIFDVDHVPGQFAEQVTISGRLNGATVLPTVTNGVTNYVIGNAAFGDALSTDTQNLGNVVVTFTSPIDTIIIEYGNHALAPANPGLQGATLHDFLFCNPNASLSATKISSVISDPVNGSNNPKAIPDAVINYQIGVNNLGPSRADADTITVTDDIPSETKMCLADLGGAGSGPVQFVNGSPSSGLSYTFSSLASTTDDLEFSNDNGATWNYTPTADADNCDAAITNFRVQPDGSFNANTSFTLSARFRIQ